MLEPDVDDEPICQFCNNGCIRCLPHLATPDCVSEASAIQDPPSVAKAPITTTSSSSSVVDSSTATALTQPDAQMANDADQNEPKAPAERIVAGMRIPD